MNTPEQTSAHVAPWWERVSPELVAQYVELAHDTRWLQRYYRRTLDPRTKNTLPGWEERFDALTAQIRAVIRPESPAAEGEAAELVEGGAA